MQSGTHAQMFSSPTLQTDTAGSSGTLVRIYQTIRHHIPDDSYAKIYTYKDEGEEILLKKVQLPMP